MCKVACTPELSDTVVLMCGREEGQKRSKLPAAPRWWSSDLVWLTLAGGSGDDPGQRSGTGTMWPVFERRSN